MALFGSIWDDMRGAFRNGNMVTKLVMVNFAIFVLVKVVNIILWMGMGGADVRGMFFEGLRHFCLPADPLTLLTHPWTPITSMFLHESLFHLINNLIGLYLFGTIVGDLTGDRRVLPIYLLGGLVGGFVFVLSANLLPIGQYALGASGAVMALAGAALILAPDYRIPLLLLGEVKVKYIVLVILLLDLVGIANQSNTGGHFAHLGGFLFGCWFIYRLRDGFDMALPVNRFLDNILLFFTQGRTIKPKRTRKKGPMQKVYKNAGEKTEVRPSEGGGNQSSFQEKLDLILDKIKAEGYESLSSEEKEFLFKASKKN